MSAMRKLLTTFQGQPLSKVPVKEISEYIERIRREEQEQRARDKKNADVILEGIRDMLRSRSKP